MGHGRTGPRAWSGELCLGSLPPSRQPPDPDLHALGIEAVGTSRNFFAFATPPAGVTHVITNPPYGDDKRGTLAMRFIEHALALAPRVAMLLRNDFDSAIGRQHIFRCHPAFAHKLVLLGRIKWFAGPKSPSDNHSWFIWDRAHRGPPTIHYVTKQEGLSILGGNELPLPPTMTVVHPAAELSEDLAHISHVTTVGAPPPPRSFRQAGGGNERP